VFRRAVAFAREHNLIVCHDAAYTQVYFNEKKPPSLLQVEGALEVAVEFNTLSKSHNMAGWRSAALLGNRHVLRTLLTLKTNLDSSHFLPIFEASIAALRGDQSWLRERNAVYRGRRDAVLRGLESAGLSAQKPEAAMYVWAKVPGDWDCQEFAVAALENTGVSLTPGTVFGQGGAGYVRIALTAPEERIDLAMERLGSWFASRKEG
jgi:LL-diaminopimelate aminotransferase